jgi:hypothetical protein
VAFRISFSVAAFCSWSLRRSFSSATLTESCCRAASLASRSLTCRSLRSRKARCLGIKLAIGDRKEKDCKAEIAARLRCAVLSLSPGLCGCHVVVITVAPPPIGIIVLVPIVHLIVVIRRADRFFVLRERARRLDLNAIAGGVVVRVECIEVLELERILLGGQEGL